MVSVEVGFLGDGAYSTKNLLGDLDPRDYVGVMRRCAIYDPVRRSNQEKGPKAPGGHVFPIERGMKRPIAAAADMGHGLGNDQGHGPDAVAGRFVPGGLAEVMGLRPILVVLVRDPLGKFKDKYLFTTI